MNAHLSRLALDRWLADQTGEPERLHLDDCACCARQLALIQEEYSAFTARFPTLEALGRRRAVRPMPPSWLWAARWRLGLAGAVVTATLILATLMVREQVGPTVDSSVRAKGGSILEMRPPRDVWRWWWATTWPPARPSFATPSAMRGGCATSCRSSAAWNCPGCSSARAPKICAGPSRSSRRRGRGPRTISSSSCTTPVTPTRARSSWGTPRGFLRLAYQLSTGYLQEARVSQGPAIGYLHDVGPVSLGGLIAYGYGQYTRSDDLSIDLHDITLWLTGEYRLRRWPRFQPLVALDIGGAWVFQRAAFADGRRDSLDSPVFRYRGRLGALAFIYRGLALGAWGHLGEVVVERASGLAAPLVGGLEVALGLEI